MSYRVTLLPGDGIGPEVATAMRSCVDATGVKIDWEEVMVGAPAIAKSGTPLPQEAIDSVRKNKVAIKGPIETPIGKGFRYARPSILRVQKRSTRRSTLSFSARTRKTFTRAWSSMSDPARRST